MMARVSSDVCSSDLDDSRLHDAVKAGRETLDEVKSLTEYQDQKATRLLTIITFLSALSSILFARFVASHPLHANFAQSSVGDYSLLLVVVTYSLFGIFAFLAISGALIVFHATHTQFRYPDNQAGVRERASSFLFYKSIIEVPPEAWADRKSTRLNSSH